jgi:hypothetical protein
MMFELENKKHFCFVCVCVWRQQLHFCLCPVPKKLEIYFPASSKQRQLKTYESYKRYDCMFLCYLGTYSRVHNILVGKYKP